nr:MAG: replication associated protein [Cressdnaviricota sp.]
MSTDKSRKHDGPNSSKYWHARFTNPKEEQFELLKKLDYDYINIGDWENNKRRPGKHYHVAIKFKRSYELNYLLNNVLLERNTHIDDYYFATKYSKSTNTTFVNYVVKEGTSRFEDGILEDKAIEKEEKVLSEKALQAARLHAARILDYDWFFENDFNYFNGSQCKALLANCQHRSGLQNLEELDNYYIWGESGTGKSSLVHFLYPECYQKIKSNEKWDSYSNYLEGHETVYFDEMDGLENYDKCMGGSEGIKTFTDVYPFAVRSNYGNSQIMIRPKRFVITSNYTPSEVFSQPDRFGKKMHHVDRFIQAFNRRFKVMHISEAHAYFRCKFDYDIKRTVGLKKGEVIEIETVKEEEENIEELQFCGENEYIKGHK